MSKSTGGSNRIDIYALSGTTVGSLLYSFVNVESSGHTTQPSGLHDFTIKDQEYNAAYATLMATVLPFDPSAGTTATTDAELEDGSGGGSSSSVIPDMVVVYVGPYDATDAARETIVEVAKFDRSSRDLAATKSSTTNMVNAKLVGQKPSGTIAIAPAKYPSAKVTIPGSSDNLTTSVLALEKWLDAA